jgi:hypothetical protein
MTELAKTGLRVHSVEGPSQDQILVGQTYKAICGVEWTPTITDLQALRSIPWCYQCVELRAVWALRDFNTYSTACNDYDREHPNP